MHCCKAEENFEMIKTTLLKIEGSLSDGLKSEVMSTDGKQKVLIIFFINYNQFLFYAGYDINSNSFIYGNQIRESIYYPSLFISDISYFIKSHHLQYMIIIFNISHKKFFFLLLLKNIVLY